MSSTVIDDATENASKDAMMPVPTPAMQNVFSATTVAAIRDGRLISMQAATEMLNAPVAARNTLEAALANGVRVTVRSVRACRAQAIAQMTPTERAISRVRTRSRRGSEALRNAARIVPTTAPAPSYGYVTPTPAPLAPAVAAAPAGYVSAYGVDACVARLAEALNAIASNATLRSYAVTINELIDELQPYAESAA